MAMTTPNFNALADCIKKPGMIRGAIENAAPELTGAQVDAVMGALAYSLASFCKSQNPAFKQERWFDYIAAKNRS